MKKFFIVLSFLYATGFLLGQESLRSIEIEGLKRTQRETVLRILKVRPGDLWQDGLEERLEQRLRQSGIFQSELEIEINKEMDHVDLFLRLRDKWTLLAFPIFSFSQGEPSGGAFVVDSNAFGKQHLLVTSGLFGEDKQSLFLLYRIPNIEGSSFNFFVSSFYMNEKVTLSDLRGGSKLGEYRRGLLGGAPRISYDFSDQINAGLQVGFFMQTNSDISQLDLKDGSSFFNPISLRYEWDNQYVYPLFSEGFSLGGDTEVTLRDGGFSYSQDLDLTASFVPVEWLQIQFYSNLYYTNGELASWKLLGKSRGNRSLPDEQIASDFYFLTDGSMEFRVVKLPFGSITLPIFYESGIFNGIDKDNQVYHGLGAGFRFYIDKVAVPAMGLDFHQSLSGAGYNITFSIGASF